MNAPALRRELVAIAEDLLDDVPTLLAELDRDETIDPVGVADSLERILARHRLLLVEVDAWTRS